MPKMPGQLLTNSAPSLPADTHRRCQECHHWVPLKLLCVADNRPLCLACWRALKGLGQGASCNIKELEERVATIEARMKQASEVAGKLAGLRKLAEE